MAEAWGILKRAKYFGKVGSLPEDAEGTEFGIREEKGAKFRSQKDWRGRLVSTLFFVRSASFVFKIF
jgi:hypothetical protein